MHDENALIEALRQSRDDRLWHPPLTSSAIQDAERRLGFVLPPLLRRLYSEVANGGFGPGVFPLTLPTEDFRHFELETVVNWYRELRDNPPREDDIGPDDPLLPMLEWPERMLKICDWGCNIYSCVDCAQPQLPVLRNDNNLSWSTFAVEDVALHSWLERAVAGENLFWLSWEGAAKVNFPTFPCPER